MSFLYIPWWIVLPILFVLGACVGSFLNVCIWRIPQKEGLLESLRGLTSPPSSCPRCRHVIRSRDNIPILGWLLLGGRCRDCRTKISWRYPAIEALNGFLWVILFLAIVPHTPNPVPQDIGLWTSLYPTKIAQGSDCAVMSVALLHYVQMLILVEALLVATFIDFDLQIIPDGVTVPAALAGLTLALVTGQTAVWPIWFQDSRLAVELLDLMGLRLPYPGFGIYVPAWIAHSPRIHAVASAILGLIVGGGIIWFVRIVAGWALRTEAMGFGDVILMAMIGVFVGWQATIVIFFLAPLIALAAVVVTLITRRERLIPYGPYLSLATLLVVLAWRPIMNDAERIFAIGPLLPVGAAVMSVVFVGCLILVKLVKRALGFKDEWMPEGEWRPADQLAFFSNRKPEAQTGLTVKMSNAPVPWAGEAAGQGRLQTDRWQQGRSPRRWPR